MNLQELYVYLESREGLLASGIGWSLVLCFGAAYVCYYLRTIAKVGFLQPPPFKSGPGNPRGGGQKADKAEGLVARL